jgi:ABC-type transporter Mla subunit MlaD
MLASRSSDIARILDDTAKPLIDSFAASGGELQKSLEDATQRATERLRAENAALVNALASRTADTLAAVEGSRNSLSETVSDLIGRLAGSNVQLSELIEKATANLSGIDEKLSGSTQSFAATTEKAAQTFSSSARLIDINTGKLNELSSQTLKEIAAIATRFDEHGRMLASASDLLGSAQTNLASTLDDRQTALEELAVGLVKKSEDIERVMRSFEDLVGRALQKAEGKTRESTDQIRSAISEVVDSAAQRFADATVEIKRTASTIRTELEETRAELKKGVLDLPQETKESTTAMRRAVSEQINALKELSDIVAKSGRTFDVSARPAPRPAPAQPSFDAPRAPAASAAPAFVRERPQPAAAPAPRPVAQAERRPAPREEAETPSGGGWVRDLLRGASREEEAANRTAEAATRGAGQPRSPLHVVESLNSLSVDIARAIDHDASVELWDRYRRGERNVFTRRLYTLKGQQTFDEIRRKYQSDSEFRGAVDRYCGDFEKLLDDVGHGDRDNIMTQTYLTSDTGKVYTMLAHAAGRLN